MKPLIYVAGPYTKPDPVLNTHRTVEVGLDLVETGKVAVLIPHLTMLAHLIRPADEAYWYGLDLDQLAHCDAMLRLAGESTGADAEERFANEQAIPVFHSITDLMGWVADWTGGPVTKDTATYYPRPGAVAASTGIAPVDQALEKVVSTFASKGHDYAGEDAWDVNFVSSGKQAGTDAATVAETLIAVKQERLRHLKDRAPTNESKLDTLLDRTVYSLIAYALALQEA